MANCPSCGGEIPQGTTFCHHCARWLGGLGSDVYPVKDPSTGPLYKVPYDQYPKAGWKIFLQWPWGFVGFALILMIVMETLSFIQEKVPVIGFLLITALIPLYVGFYILGAKLLQRQPCHFADFFKGFHYYRPLIIFGFIMNIIRLPQWDLLPLFFIVFLLFFLFTPLLIIDRHLGLWDAMVYSSKTILRRPLDFLVFLILLGIIVWLCFLPLGIAMQIAQFGFPSGQRLLALISMAIGVFVLPVISCAITAAYADLFGFQSKEY